MNSGDGLRASDGTLKAIEVSQKIKIDPSADAAATNLILAPQHSAEDYGSGI